MPLSCIYGSNGTRRLSSLPDGTLAHRAQQGDRCAFETLARRYRNAVWAVAFLRTGDREEAEDLTQEALLRAWQRLPTLQEPAAFPAWLRAIALNACRSWVRRARAWPVSLDAAPEAASLPDPTPRPLETLLAREAQRAWRQALLTLPEANRIALLMHVWGRYSYEEIAEFLAVPVTTVEGRIHRAKLQLRRLLRAEAAELLGEPRHRWNQKEEPMKTDETAATDRALALTLFTHQFKTLVDAGLSLVRIMLTMEQSAPEPYGPYMADLRPPIEQGDILSRVMGQRPDLFPAFYIKMIRVGEIGGILEETLHCLSVLLDEGWKLARLSGQEAMMQTLLFPTDRTPQEWADLSETQRKLTLMLFCRSLSLLLTAGVPLRMILETVAELLPGQQREAVRLAAQSDLTREDAPPLPPMQAQKGRFHEREEPTSLLAEPLAQIGFLPLLVTQLMSVGEQAGQLDRMMDKAAQIYQHELQCELLRAATGTRAKSRRPSR